MANRSTSPAPLSAFLEGDPGFQFLSSLLPDALLVVDPEGTVVHASAEAEALLGSDLAGQPFADLVHPSDRGAFLVGSSFRSVGPRDFRAANAPPSRWLSATVIAPRDSDDLHPSLRGAALLLVRDVPVGTSGARDRVDVLRRALDAANNLIVVTDPHADDNPLVFVNEHFLAVTGYTREEVIGRNCRFLQNKPDGTRDDDQEGVRRLARAAEEGEEAHVVLRNYRKDGTLFYNELFVTPLYDSEGQLLHFIGVQNDITDRVLAEREAKSKASLVEAFFDSAPVLMGVMQRTDEGLVHQMANDQTASIFEQTGGDVVGASPAELGFTPSEADRWREAVERSAEKGEPVTFETVYPWDSAPYGEGVRHLRFTVSRVRTDGESADELYSYVGEDETASRHAERERRLLAAAVGSAAESIIVTDNSLDAPGPTIVYANEAHCRIFGYEMDEVIGQSPRMFQGPKTDRGVLDRIRRKLEAGEPVRSETTNYRKDGSEFILEWEIAPVFGEDGRVENWVGTQRDVTDQRRLEHEVLEAAAREQEHLAREFHDGLGQVLTGTRLLLETLTADIEHADPASADLHALAKRAARAAHHLADAHEQARTLAHGLFPVNVEADGLVLALERLAADVRKDTGTDVELESPPVVRVESAEAAGHLYRIAQEAIANALRHGHAQSITLTLYRDGGDLVLSIQDDGVGVPDSVLEGKDGLGIRTMAYRARRIGGGLTIQALDAGGTTVTVYCPSRDEGADE